MVERQGVVVPHAGVRRNKNEGGTDRHDAARVRRCGQTRAAMHRVGPGLRVGDSYGMPP